MDGCEALLLVAPQERLISVAPLAGERAHC
jgi:hypothetical protein